MLLARAPAASDGPGPRERYFFALFRCLEAALLALWVYSPYAPYFTALNGLDPLKALSIGYLLFAGLMLLAERRGIGRHRLMAGLTVDVGVFAALAWLLPVGFDSAALVMLVNLAAGGLLLDNRQSALITLGAVGVLFGHYLANRLGAGSDTADIARSLMFTAIYAATVLFCQMLASRARQSQALADERGQQLAEMAQMNELIITRMRTGVILLDRHHRILLSNEAAGQLCRNPLEKNRALREIAPALNTLLLNWRQHPDTRPQALSLHALGPEVIPRFVALTLHDVHYLVFLEDSRVFSGRADELQLANLGRLSASIAHEIRNPLAAITYAQQLLEESPALGDDDRRLLEIIGLQSRRMNAIIRNVIGLAKRTPANPQRIALNDFIAAFIDEHVATHPQDRGNILWQAEPQAAFGLFDPSHLQQVLHVLLNNALAYGHAPQQPARIRIALHLENGQPVIDVIDRGPGIAPEQLPHLFSPFHTGSEQGSGLGLYIAKQLADANQAQLRYEAELGGGSRFSLRLSGGNALLAV